MVVLVTYACFLCIFVILFSQTCLPLSDAIRDFLLVFLSTTVIYIFFFLLDRILVHLIWSSWRTCAIVKDLWLKLLSNYSFIFKSNDRQAAYHHLCRVARDRSGASTAAILRLCKTSKGLVPHIGLA